MSEQNPTNTLQHLSEQLKAAREELKHNTLEALQPVLQKFFDKFGVWPYDITVSMRPVFTLGAPEATNFHIEVEA